MKPKVLTDRGWPDVQSGLVIGRGDFARSQVWWLLLLIAAVLAGIQLGSAVQAADDGPRVILIRHADKDVHRGDYNLSPAGFLRAIALGRLIPACFGWPDEIGTFYLNPVSSKNARSYQTAVPLAVATGVSIQILETSLNDSLALGQQLRQRLVGTSGLHVLIWEHTRMPVLAKGLGWGAMPPVDDADFGKLIVLYYNKQAQLLKVDQLRQDDLFLLPCFIRGQSFGGFESDLKPKP